MTGIATVIHGNALALDIADASVDLVVTSPPYFGLRSYQDNGEHYEGQIGAEATPAEFVDALIAATREMMRVLKPSGSIWVNLGDKYSGAQAQNIGGTSRTVDSAKVWAQTNPKNTGIPAKSLMGFPWRYALRCIDELGLILRAEVIWSKVNGLPESIVDRVRRSHEQWFHFVLRPRYFSAVDEIREGYAPGTADRYKSGYGNNSRALTGQHSSGVLRSMGEGDGGPTDVNPLGKLPGSVWRAASDGPSVVRSVLDAVAAGAITVEEGERILQCSTDAHIFSPTSTSPKDAGNGQGIESPPATAKHPSSARDERTWRTGSATNCSSDPSLTDSPSTTSAETPAASDQTTSSQSPSARTSAAPTQSEQSVGTDTHSRTPTQTSLPQGSLTRNAEPAPSRESDAGESVWWVPTQPLKVPAHLGIDHFAAFSMEFPRRIIRGWSPAGVCVACGEGRRPVSEKSASGYVQVGTGGRDPSWQAINRAEWQTNVQRTITGYACACPDTSAPTTPGVVLDPFSGTGTTALVAKVLGRHGIGVDLSADYCRLAEWRTNDPGQIASAMEVEKPPVEIAGQIDLFDIEATA